MFMMDSVSNQGGFVWNYLPDRSRRWGEMEAKPTMVWLQSPGTPDVGLMLLRAYKVTGDDYYYHSARKVADVLIKGQLPCGGWNYMFDLDGDDSLRQWYSTIGQSAWRLEEFQHYYGNATFDDEGTANAGEFLLRLSLVEKAKGEETKSVRKALDRYISFVLESQYDNGGWPQRYPLMYDHPFRGKADYTHFITLNDDVLLKNIEFLKLCRDMLGMTELQPRIRKAMLLLPQLQQPLPYAGWSDQYTLDMKPAHARSYEPRAVNTATTQKIILKCLDFYRETGDTTFVVRLPEAIRFLQSQKLPQQDVAKWEHHAKEEGMALMPRFLDPDAGKPLYVHRRGSNVYNGEYYTDEELSGTIAHYSSAAWINTDRLWEAYRLRDSSLAHQSPHHWEMPQRSVEQIMEDFKDGRWISPLRQISNPYLPIPDDKTKEKSFTTQYAQTMVGDEYDTSPYTPDTPVYGISTATWLRNMASLLGAVENDTTFHLYTIHSANSGTIHSTNSAGAPTSLETSIRQTHEPSISVEVTNYGARIVSLNVITPNGKTQDIVLGFDSLSHYKRIKQNFGAVVGRYIGRMRLPDGTRISHGGKPGFANRFFHLIAQTDSSLTLRYISPDGESGFQGELVLDVAYTITDDSTLRIDYTATTTKPTHLNISNHSFFNLTGNHGNKILDEQLYLNADSIVEFNADKNVTGRILAVDDDFDFLKMRKIDHGYDHCYKLSSHNLSEPAAVLTDNETKLQLSVYTTEPGIQVYTANGHKGNIIGKNGIYYPQHNAICLETMHFPDTPNQPHFPSTKLLPGETFHSSTIFKVSSTLSRD